MFQLQEQRVTCTIKETRKKKTRIKYLTKNPTCHILAKITKVINGK